MDFPGRIIKLFKKQLPIRLILFIVVSIWCVGIVSGPLFPDSAYAIIASPFLRKMYGAVCHQHIEKTWLLNGHYFFVCARCTGIYSGALIVSFISLFSFSKLPVKMTLLYISSIPMLADVISTTTGIYSYSKYIALLTGIFFGSAVFAYILAGIENNFVDKSL
jgi:uncharacterized membrane protein